MTIKGVIGEIQTYPHENMFRVVDKNGRYLVTIWHADTMPFVINDVVEVTVRKPVPFKYGDKTQS